MSNIEMVNSRLKTIIDGIKLSLKGIIPDELIGNIMIEGSTSSTNLEDIDKIKSVIGDSVIYEGQAPTELEVELRVGKYIVTLGHACLKHYKFYVESEDSFEVYVEKNKNSYVYDSDLTLKDVLLAIKLANFLDTE